MKLICSVLVTAVLLGSAVGDDLDYETYLNRDETYHLAWSIDSENVTFRVTVDTVGWVGLGLSHTGNMQGSDIMTAWVTDSGTKIQDRFADARGLPRLDASQDWTLISGSEANGKTVITVTRKLRTCDPDDLEITSDTARMIWAFGTNDPTGADPYYHSSNRGSKSLMLFKNGNSRKMLPDDAFTLDAAVDDFPVPSDTTTYHCEGITLPPEINSKHHIVGMEGFVQPGHEGIVHHILMYACTDNNNVARAFAKTRKFPKCFEDPLISSCKNIVMAWAIGNDGVFYPQEAGYSIGGQGDPVYYVMQMHYDNPTRRSGLVDASGMRFFVTPTLRQHDIGVSMVGDASGLLIPPHQKEYHALGFCGQGCSKKFLPPSGVKVIATVLHSHLLGRKMYLYQTRNGKLVNVVDKDDYYDFDFQKTNILKTPIQYMPGDEMQMACYYDSTGKSRMTYGGEPTNFEMCLAFLSYYPRAALGDCGSRPSWNYPDGNGGMVNLLPTITDYDGQLHQFDWKNKTVSDYFQDFTYKSNQHLVCTSAYDFNDYLVETYTPYIEESRPSQPDVCPNNNNNNNA